MTAFVINNLINLQVSKEEIGGLLSLLHPCELRLSKGLAAPWLMGQTKRHYYS